MITSCAVKEPPRESSYFRNDLPETKAEFIKHKKKCLRIKEGFMGSTIDNTVLLNTSFEGEVSDIYEYTYLIWVYTGFYDSELVHHPWYLYPMTPKGEIMRKGLLRGITLKNIPNKAAHTNPLHAK